MWRLERPAAAEFVDYRSLLNTRTTFPLMLASDELTKW
jgi:hypothetical protein